MVVLGHRNFAKHSDTGNQLRQRPRPCLHIPRQQWQTSFSGKALCSLSTPSARGRRLAVANIADIFEPPLKPAIFGGDGSFDPADFFTCTFGVGVDVPPKMQVSKNGQCDLWTCNFVTQSCRIKNREELKLYLRYCPGFYLQLCSHKAADLKTRE